MKMNKLALSLFLLVICTEIIDYIVAHDETVNVTSMIGSEDSYIQLKRRSPSCYYIRRPKEEKLKRKEDICVGILADEFFDAHKVEMVNPNHKTIYKQLKQHHPDIHEEHFKTGFSSEVIKPRFANPYRLRGVNINGNVVQEYMFTCLAKDYSTKNIQQYFVSPEYIGIQSSVEMVTRFIFGYNKKKEVVVVAKAEKKLHPRGHEKTSNATSVTMKPTSAKSSDESSNEESKDEYYESDESGSW